MTIEMIRHKGLNCPTIICDICQHRILNVGMAMVVWEQGKMNEYKIVHKGSCDNKKKYPLSEELKSWLCNLLFNVKLTPKEVKSITNNYKKWGL